MRRLPVRFRPSALVRQTKPNLELRKTRRSGRAHNPADAGPTPAFGVPWKGIEVVITSRTRNAVVLRGAWVRIPPFPLRSRKSSRTPGSDAETELEGTLSRKGEPPASGPTSGSPADPIRRTLPPRSGGRRAGAVRNRLAGTPGRVRTSIRARRTVGPVGRPATRKTAA